MSFNKRGNMAVDCIPFELAGLQLYRSEYAEVNTFE